LPLIFGPPGHLLEHLSSSKWNPSDAAG